MNLPSPVQTSPRMPPMAAPDFMAGQVVLSDAAFEQIRAWLLRTSGISLAGGKKAMVAGRLAKRLKQLGLSSYEDYHRMMLSQPGEAQRALDLLTTNETHFFREKPHFDFLRERILPASTRPLRVWSAAASSGQEAYSLAMVLARHASHDGWEVFGTDISADVIERAQRGQYDIRQAGQIPPEDLRAYCLRGIGSQDGTFMVSPELRRRVRFARMNLATELPDVGMFDLILLRNVLIYFPPEVKRQVVGRLVAQLRPGGWLMVGHSESLSDLGLLTALAPSVYGKP